MSSIRAHFQRARYNTAYIGKWRLDGTDYFGTGICPEEWDAPGKPFRRLFHQRNNELHDLEPDPFELDNIYGSPGTEQTTADLELLMQRVNTDETR